MVHEVELALSVEPPEAPEPRVVEVVWVWDVDMRRVRGGKGRDEHDEDVERQGGVCGSAQGNRRRGVVGGGTLLLVAVGVGDERIARVDTVVLEHVDAVDGPAERPVPDEPVEAHLDERPEVMPPTAVVR